MDRARSTDNIPTFALRSIEFRRHIPFAHSARRVSLISMRVSRLKGTQLVPLMQRELASWAPIIAMRLSLVPSSACTPSSRPPPTMNENGTNRAIGPESWLAVSAFCPRALVQHGATFPLLLGLDEQSLKIIRIIGDGSLLPSVQVYMGWNHSYSSILPMLLIMQEQGLCISSLAKCVFLFLYY